MKSSFLLAAFSVGPVLASLLALPACGSDKSTTAAPIPTADASAPSDAGGASDASPPRKLVASPLVPGGVGNLLLDPSFSLLNSQGSSLGCFFGYYQDTGDQFIPDTTTDSRSPAGFAGSVALLHAAAATDKSSREIALIASVIGGTGPYHASVWVSKSNIAGAPVDLASTDKLSLSLDTNPDAQPPAMDVSYPLVADPTPMRASNGRAWVRYAVDVTDPLPDGVFLVIRTGSKGGMFELAAPSVTSSALDQGLATQALVRSQARPQSPENRALIRRYLSMPRHLERKAAHPVRGEF